MSESYVGNITLYLDKPMEIEFKNRMIEMRAGEYSVSDDGDNEDIKSFGLLLEEKIKKILKKEVQVKNYVEYIQHPENKKGNVKLPNIAINIEVNDIKCLIIGFGVNEIILNEERFEIVYIPILSEKGFHIIDNKYFLFSTSSK